MDDVFPVEPVLMHGVSLDELREVARLARAGQLELLPGGGVLGRRQVRRDTAWRERLETEAGVGVLRSYVVDVRNGRTPLPPEVPGVTVDARAAGQCTRVAAATDGRSVVDKDMLIVVVSSATVYFMTVPLKLKPMLKVDVGEVEADEGVPSSWTHEFELPGGQLADALDGPLSRESVEHIGQ
jgi:hypothetical protein